MISISFIIPFYNGANTIIRTLFSIYKIPLSKEEYEVIVVDDCSPVAAVEVLSPYINEFPNLKVIRHKQNLRQGGARNTGMSIANGKYIAFVDQDDSVHSDNMFNAIQKAVGTNVDILSCHYFVQNEQGECVEVGIKYPDIAQLDGKTFCEEYYDVHDSIGPWSYLYKSEYIKRINRPMQEGVLLEDPDWTIWHLINAQTIAFFSAPIYYWIQYPHSVSHATCYYMNRADWIKAGYRKIVDAKKYKELSVLFSEKIIADGRWNIEGAFRTLWKVDNYCLFYRHLGTTLHELQRMQWNGMVNFLINYPKLSLCLLYLFGSPLKYLNNARHSIIK